VDREWAITVIVNTTAVLKVVSRLGADEGT
jgi:hypothetical protein